MRDMASLIETLKQVLDGCQIYWLDFSRWTHHHRSAFHEQMEALFSELGSIQGDKSAFSSLTPPESGTLPIIRITSPRGLKILGDHYKHLEYYRVPMVVMLAIENFDDSILWQVHFISDLLDLRRHLRRQVTIPLILFTTQEIPLNQYEQHLVSFLGFKLVNVIATPGADGSIIIVNQFIPELVSELLPIHLTYLLGREMVNKIIKMRPLEEKFDFLLACQNLRTFIYPVMVTAGKQFEARWNKVERECNTYFATLKDLAIKEITNGFDGKTLRQQPRLSELQTYREKAEGIFQEFSKQAHAFLAKARQALWEVSAEILRNVINHLYFTEEFLDSSRRVSQYLLIPEGSLVHVVRQQVLLDLFEVMVMKPLRELKKLQERFFSHLHEHLNATLGPIFVLEMLVANLPPWATAHLKNAEGSQAKRTLVIHKQDNPIITLHVILDEKIVKVELSCKKHARKYKKRTFTPCIIPKDNKLDEFKVIDGQQIKRLRESNFLPLEIQEILEELQVKLDPIVNRIMSLTTDAPILFDQEQLLLLSKVLLLLAYQEQPEVAHPDIRQQFRNQFGKLCRDFKW